MDAAPAPRARRSSMGRPRKEDNAIWELDVRKGELKRAMFRIGPSLRRIAADPMYRRESSVILAELARLAQQDSNRAP